MRTKLITLVLACVGFVAILAVRAGGTGPQSRSAVPPGNVPARFYQDSRAELAFARARGDARVMLVIAAREGAADNVARAVTAAGGSVRYRNEAVSYLRVEVPIDRVEEISDSDDVEAAALDVNAMTTRTILGGLRDEAAAGDPWPAGLPGPTGIAQASQEWPPRWPDYPMTKPYSPVADLGAAELRRRHPSYDGRGITIGHVEMGVDLLLPEFERAYTLDGRPTHKVVDVRTALEPGHTHGEHSRRTPWAAMDQEVTEGSFTAGGHSYTPPRAGRFRFGIFDGRRLCDNLKRRDPEAPPPPPFSLEEPPAPDPECRFGVLWDEQTNEVWLDTNRDRSFAGERALKEYGATRDIATIGTDEPSTPEREQFAFTVQIAPTRKAVAINVLNGGHATMVAGSAEGSRGTRGRYDGVAPGAQLIVIDYGGECIGGAIEGFIDAFADPRVDVVLFEQNVWLVQPYRLGDGRFPATIITSRLIDKYKKPFVVPGDNSPGVNAISEHGNARWAFAVGAYEAKESYRINDGFLVEHDDNLHHVGSWGPNGVGAVKPDILAPSGYLTSEIPIGNYARPGIKGLYRLPPGYGIGGGTSQATPTMAGALALLLSAAKQERVPYDAMRIWLAVTGSARPVGHLSAHQQGHGLVQVAPALELLKAYAKTAPSISIESRAPVKTPYSHWLERPHEGVGLWESGWRPGDTGDRTITLTRRGGPPEPMRFTASWRGAGRTFSSAGEVTLPRDTPTPFMVAVSPALAGAHSALLTFDHPSVPGHAHRLMATIVAAEPFEPAAKFTSVKKDKLARPGPFMPYYFSVPRGAEALALSPTGAALSMLDPIGRRMWVASGGRTVPLPAHGTWEVVVRIPNDALDLAWSTERGVLAPRAPYTLEATPLGVRIDAPASLAMELGTSQAIDVSVSNAFGAFDGGLATMAIGAARQVRSRFKAKEQRVFDVRVPEGAPFLGAEVAEASGAGDVDLYLFDCTGKGCRPAGAALGLGGSPRLRRLNPKAGVWKIVADAAHLAEDGIVLDYMDVVADPALGVIAAADGVRKRDVGARWTAKANVWLMKRPEGDRAPRAVFMVHALKDGALVPVALRTVPIEVNGGTNPPSR